MKPYKNLTTQHLGLLLLLARATGYAGLLLTLVAFLAIAIVFFKLGLKAVLPMIVFIPIAISVLFLSGVMAAIVAFEEGYRKRTEHFVGNSAI